VSFEELDLTDRRMSIINVKSRGLMGREAMLILHKRRTALSPKMESLDKVYSSIINPYLNTVGVFHLPSLEMMIECNKIFARSMNKNQLWS